MSEVLRVISSSPGDLQPVFATILEKAVHICDAKFGNLWLRERDNFRIGATHGSPAEWSDFLRREPLFQVDPRFGLGRLILTKQTYQVADVAAEPTYQDKLRVATIELAHARTLVGVPLVRDGEVIGAFAIYRQEVRPFTDKQIEVVENFAAQAVIAIENARLFEAERQRTQELTESLEQQTATADVLGVISSSPGDLQPVFGAMLEKRREDLWRELRQHLPLGWRCIASDCDVPHAGRFRQATRTDAVSTEPGQPRGRNAGGKGGHARRRFSPG
jgi:GAF domain-containing protein